MDLQTKSGFVGASLAEPPIPKLRKKEEEKKGAGLPYPWGAAPGAGTSVPEGFLGLGRAASSLSAFFGGPQTLIGGLFASNLGSVILAAGALAWLGALAAVAWSLWSSVSGEEKAAASAFFPALPALAPSKPSAAAPANRSLEFVRKANAGSLSFEEERPGAPKEGPKDAPKDALKGGGKIEGKAVEAAPAPQVPNPADLLKKGLTQEGFIRKLSDGSGMAVGASLNANKLNTKNFELTKTFASAGAGSQFKLTAFTKRSFRGTDGAASHRIAASGASRAMGQLKFVDSKSRMAFRSQDPAAAKQGATDAFEQAKTSGVGSLGLSSASSDVVVPASTASDTYSVPEVGKSTNTTPYQNSVDSAKNSSDNAGLYKAIGIALLIAGAALITTGIGLLNCTTFPIGLAFIAAGVTLMAFGIFFLALGLSEANNASNNGNNISKNYGQTGQGSTVSDCAQKSYSTGTNTDTVCGTSSTYDTSQGNNVATNTSAESNTASAQ